MLKNVLVTGAAGYLGSLLVKKLVENKVAYGIGNIVATDVREMREKLDIIFEKIDVRDQGVLELLQKYKIDTIVHLACIVSPGKKSNRELEYSVDVIGTQNMLKAASAAGAKRIIISSSGAAYGYHPENAKWLTEADPIRGNYEFAYSYHKRLVEEELARYRASHPELEQTIFRIGTILGANTNNQITDLFKKPVQIGISGSETPFVFIWDQDVVDCFIKAITSEKTGIYNLAGDGALTLKERAKLLKKPVINIPAKVIQTGLIVLKKIGLTQYGPEQLNFLRYRPVLDNSKLKKEFGFIPQKTSNEVFQYYLKAAFKI